MLICWYWSTNKLRKAGVVPQGRTIPDCFKGRKPNSNLIILLRDPDRFVDETLCTSALYVEQTFTIPRS